MDEKNLEAIDEFSALYIDGITLSTTVNCICIVSEVILSIKPESEKQKQIQTATRTIYLPMAEKIVFDVWTVSFYNDPNDFQERYFKAVQDALNKILHVLEKALEKLGNPSMALYCTSIIEADMKPLDAVTTFLGLDTDNGEAKEESRESNSASPESDEGKKTAQKTTLPTPGRSPIARSSRSCGRSMARSKSQNSPMS